MKYRIPRILIVFQSQNSLLECFDTVNKFVEKNMEQLVHYDHVIDECKKRQSDSTGYWSVDMKKDFVNAPHWVDCKIGIGSVKKVEGQKKRF